MKALLHLLCCGMLLTTATASAQQLINGGFEPKASLTPCTDVPVANYNNNMGGSWAIGTNTTMQIANSSCSQGSPVEGTYFGVLKYTPGKSAIASFKLDKMMTVGTQYKLAVNYKAATGQASGVMCSIRYGYGSDSVTADSFVAFSEPVSFTTWTKDTFKITPKKASQFVWVDVAVLGGDPYIVHFDGLTMVGIPPITTGIENVTAGNGIQLSPNPCTDNTTLSLDENIALPYSLHVYDVTGRVVMKKTGLNDRKITIGKAELGSGMFFLKLADCKQQTYTSRLLIQ